MNRIKIIAKHHLRTGDRRLKGNLSYWTARIVGVEGEFQGRSKPEAVGRAVLHLVKWKLSEPERMEVPNEQ